MQMPVSPLQVCFGPNQNRHVPMAACCNGACNWVGSLGNTVVFKHDKERRDAHHFCPECHEVCEPLTERES